MSGQIPAGRFSNKNAKTQKKARLNAEEDELRLQLRLLARTSNNAAFSQIIQNLFKAETYYQKQLKYYFDMVELYNNWWKTKNISSPKNAETIIVAKVENARESAANAFLDLSKAVRQFEKYGNEKLKVYTKAISDFFRNKYKLERFILNLPVLTVPQLEDPSLHNAYAVPALAPSGSGFSGGLSASGTGSSQSTLGSASSVNTAFAQRVHNALDMSLLSVGGLNTRTFSSEKDPLYQFLNNIRNGRAYPLGATYNLGFDRGDSKGGKRRTRRRR